MPDSQTPQTGIRKPFLIALAVFALAQAIVWFNPNFSFAERLHWFRFTGLVAAAPLLWTLLRPEFTARGKLICAATGVAVALALWTSVIQEGYYGDATPMCVWRWKSANPANVGPNRTSPVVPVSAVIGAATTTSPYEHPRWDYPQFLGQERNATINGIELATNWTDAPPRELWRTNVGAAWSSFAIVGTLAITQEQLGDDEAVVCRDLETSEIVWTTLNANAKFSEAYGGDGPRATPTVHDGIVYAMGATGDLQAIELASGDVLWKRNILTDANAANLEWGMAGSPLVFDNTVVVSPGGMADHSVVAYDRTSGEIQWHAGTSRAAYSSPMLANFGGVKQVVLLNGPGLEGYDATSGELLWSYPWTVNGGMMTTITQPVVIRSNNGTSCQFFISGGYGKGCVLLKVQGNTNGFDVSEVWEPNRSLKSKFNTMVHHAGFVYGMDDKVMTCIDLSDGSRRWKKGRYGYGQLMLVDDVIVVQAESGELALVRATPETFDELARIAPLSRKTWNNPALRGNRLLLRNDEEAVCLELPTASGSL